jgi:hypothetical protein
MKPSFILLFLFCAVAATAVHAQTRPADTTKMAMDTSQAQRVPVRKGERHAAQGPVSVSLPQATKDSIIKNIRAIFQRINHDTTLRTVDLDIDTMVEIIGGAPDNGADVTGYFRNDTLCKLIMSFGPSFGIKDWEYYYDKGEVVFVYEKDRHYPETKDGLDHERLVVGFEGRFYFNKGRLIEKIIKRYDQFMAEKIDDKYIRDLLDDTTPYADALKREMKRKN